MSGSCKPVPVLAVHKRDGRVAARFGSYSEAASWAGVHVTSVRKAAERLSLSRGPYMWRRADRWSGHETFAARAKHRPVAVMGGGHLRWFPTAADAAEALGTNASAVVAAVSKKAMVMGLYQVAYLTSTDDWSRLRALVEEKLEERGGR